VQVLLQTLRYTTMNYLMPRFFIVCLIVGSLQQETAGEADTVCIKTHTGGCRNHKQIHISTVPNVDSVAICLNECRMNEFCTGFSLSIKKKVCILYSGECEKDGNQNWDYYRAESCMGDSEIDAPGDSGDNGNQANEWTDDNCAQCGTNTECGLVDMFDAKLDILMTFTKCQCLPGHLGDPYTECRAYKGCRFSGFSGKCYHYGPNLRGSEYVWMSCERLGGENCIEDFTGDDVFAEDRGLPIKHL